ncbi:MAG: helix-turn-helix domain-containing protein [Anaerolineae bacterium]
MSGFAPSQVSAMLGIPPATLRRYTKLFASYLSPDTQLQRGRRYSEADIRTLGRARELFEAGLSVEHVRERLPATSDGVAATYSSYPNAPGKDEEQGVKAGIPAEPPEDKNAARHQLQYLSESLETLATASANLARKQTVAEDRQSRMEERLAMTEYKLARLEEWLKLPWYRRLFSGPPFWG